MQSIIKNIRALHLTISEKKKLFTLTNYLVRSELNSIKNVTNNFVSSTNSNSNYNLKINFLTFIRDQMATRRFAR